MNFELCVDAAHSEISDAHMANRVHNLFLANVTSESVSTTPRSNWCYSSQQSGQSGWISLSAQDETMTHTAASWPRLVATRRPPLSVLERGARGYGQFVPFRQFKGAQNPNDQTEKPERSGGLTQSRRLHVYIQ